MALSADVRRKLGLKKGDVVAVDETADGVLITPQELVAVKALDRIGEALRQEGLSLDELIKSGRQERTELIQEAYGIQPDEQSNTGASMTPQREEVHIHGRTTSTD